MYNLKNQLQRSYQLLVNDSNDIHNLDSNDTHNLYISSRNLLMFTSRNRLNKLYTTYFFSEINKDDEDFDIM